MSKWKAQKDIAISAYKYIRSRKEGKKKSLNTPWEKVNDAGVNGIEWNSLVVIAGRPGSGKTTLLSQLEREIEEEVKILNFQFDMLGRTQMIRDISSVMNMSYKEILSAKKINNKIKTINEKELEKIKVIASKMSRKDVDTVEQPMTIDELIDTIDDYMDENATMDERGMKRYKKTLITLDHSYLVKTKGSQSKTEMLYDLGEMMTQIKRKYPVIIIILSQLKREVEAPERNVEGKYGNYIHSTDILGGDALTQTADMVMALNKPADRNIFYFGPERYMINDPDTIVIHFLKTRSDTTRMSFFKAEFNKMRITELETPNKK